MNSTTTAVRNTLLLFALSLLTTLSSAQTYKWMSVGSFQSWYSSSGSEIDEGRVQVQQDGFRWPALYRNQDNICSKGLWIGTTNYKDANGITYKHKIVHIGPRNKGTTEFFPVSMRMVSKFAQPAVTVNGAPTEGMHAAIDSIDASLEADCIIDTRVNTSIGISMSRRILGFGTSEHDNYVIIEYTFTNTGLTDNNGGKRDAVTLTGVYFYWQHRYAVCADTRYIIGNSSGWGVNTMIDVVGDTTAPHTFFPSGGPFNSDNTIRASYAWHGKYSSFTGGYDNIGGAIFVPYYQYQKGDTAGRLGASQFVGMATFFAQKSPSENVDDPRQPSTTGYEGSDAVYNSNDPAESLNSAKMDSQYVWMSRGHMIPRHADKIGATGDPATGSSGGSGYSSTNGYGPYTLAPGQSIRIVVAEAAAGLSREANIEIGRAYKHASASTRDAALIPYNGTSKTKNNWVYTGRDSLFKTFQKAKSNFISGYAVGANAVPPPDLFNVTTGVGRIILSWRKNAGDTKTVKYQIWRAVGQYDSTYHMIWEGTDAVYYDSSAHPGEDYFYFLIGIDAAGTTSSRYYTQTYDAVKSYMIPSGVEQHDGLPTTFALGQNYPNPFNPSTTIQYSVAAARHVRIVVYDCIGRAVAMLVDKTMQPGVYTARWNAASMPSGLYFYRLTAGDFTEVKKMLVQK